MKDEYLVWWTTQEDCERITKREKVKVPTYISEEFNSRIGRSGRGRLWVHESINLNSIEWDDSSEVSERCSESGGIVFHSTDIDYVSGLDGIITDCKLQKVES